MDDLRAFTIRIPASLAEQVEARAKISRRTRNAEINLLLERGIDVAVAADLKLLRSSEGS